jgi:hypothetical protein
VTFGIFFKVSDGMSGTILASNLTGHTVPTSPTVTVASNMMGVVFTTDSNNNAIPAASRPGRWQATFVVV